MNRNRKYGDDIIEFIRNHVKTCTDKEIAQMVSQQWNINVSESSITNLKKKYDIKSGVRRGTFPKGHVPMNKGTKGIMNVGGNKTSYKKGDRPLNWVPVGTERVDRDGYVMIKVQEDGPYNHRWRLKNRIVWEEHYGKTLAKNEKILFLDGNPQNITIENMKLVTDAELAVMNKSKLVFKDADSNNVGINIARVKIAINKKKKGRNQNA